MKIAKYPLLSCLVLGLFFCDPTPPEAAAHGGSYPPAPPPPSVVNRPSVTAGGAVTGGPLSGVKTPPGGKGEATGGGPKTPPTTGGGSGDSPTTGGGGGSPGPESGGSGGGNPGPTSGGGSGADTGGGGGNGDGGATDGTGNPGPVSGGTTAPPKFGGGGAPKPALPGRAGAGARGPFSRGSGLAKKANRADGLPIWLQWWDHNKYRFIDLRSRGALRDTPSSGGGLLIGNGKRTLIETSFAPTQADVRDRIVPALKEALAVDDADVLDSTVMALARIIRPEDARLCLGEIRTALKSRHSTVQEAAILAFGLLGRRDAVSLLVEVMNDTSSGRAELGIEGGVPDLQRAMAAIALGYIGESSTVSALQAVVTSAAASERDLRGAAILALGMYRTDGDTIIPFLMHQMASNKFDDDTAAQIPIALARAGATAAVPVLMKCVNDRNAGLHLQESSIIALGSLAQGSDREVIDSLLEVVEQGSRVSTRHFALLALGDIAERAIGSSFPGDREAALRIAKSFVGELKKSKHPDQQPVAAVALGVVGRRITQEPALRDQLEQALIDKFEAERSPFDQCAYILALGLFGARSQASRVSTLMVETDLALVASYCAVTVGLLEHQESSPWLRKVALEEFDPSLRFNAAMSLALLGDPSVCGDLIRGYTEAQTLAVKSSLARAIGLLGHRSAIDPLIDVLRDDRASGLSRGFAAVGLGMLAEKTIVPWNTAIAVGSNFTVTTTAIAEVLEIL